MSSSSLRSTEVSLLPYAGALVVVGWASLRAAGQQGDFDLGYPLLFVALIAIAHLGLRLGAPHRDQLILPLAMALAAMGLVMVARLAPRLLPREALALTLGVAAMVTLASLRPVLRWLKLYRYTLASLALLLLAAAIVFDIDAGVGERLWLRVGALSFQPSEPAKILMVSFFAAYLEEQRQLVTHTGARLGPLTLPPLPYLGPLLAMWGLSMALLVVAKDLGGAMLFFGTFLAVLYVASSRLSFVAIGAVLFLTGSAVSYQFFHHVRERFDVWLNPWNQPQGPGFQIIQALTSMSAGGLLGRGLGLGHPELVPAVHTDFVMASIGEELGLAGSLAVALLLLILVYRGLRIASEARDAFSCLLAAGLSSVLGLQTLVILAGNLKLIPLTGVNLPLVSYGGTSMVTTFVACGLLLRISSQSRGEEP